LLWETEWSSIYEEKSKSYDVIKEVSESYYLGYLVDHDYQRGNCLWKLLEDSTKEGYAKLD